MHAEFLSYHDQTVVMRVSLDIYGMEPLLKAAHKFTRQCYVHLELSDANAVLCRLRSKQAMQNLTALAGEFSNEVLDQALRARLLAATEPVRGLLLAQAFSKTNLIHPELDEEPVQGESLGIGGSDGQH